MKELIIRASSLPGLFDCPARWLAQNVEGRRTRTTGPAHLGTSLHHATGRFDQSRIEDSVILVEDAVDIFIDRVKNPTEEDGEVVWEQDMPKQKAVDVGVALTIDYCERISFNYHFSGVELKLNPMTIDVQQEGVKITLTGTTDRVRSSTTESSSWWEKDDGDGLETKFGICDVKSGKRVIDSQGRIAIDKHVAQLGQYELLQLMTRTDYGYNFTLPAEVIALPTSGTHRQIAVAQVETPSRLLLGDETHPMGLLHAAAKMARAELFPGNPRSMLCSEKYCPAYRTCWWRGVK